MTYVSTRYDSVSLLPESQDNWYNFTKRRGNLTIWFLDDVDIEEVDRCIESIGRNISEASATIFDPETASIAGMAAAIQTGADIRDLWQAVNGRKRLSQVTTVSWNGCKAIGSAMNKKCVAITEQQGRSSAMKNL
ncbi:MAG: hypothetical protein COC24_019010 [Alphaproteobacteria bacterium]|nr:hypothetical protein [Alphaproteobacteria bacterium]